MAYQRMPTYDGTPRRPVSYPYFVFTITNFSPLVERTARYQVPYQNWSQQRQGAMLIPGVPVHLGATSTDEHERLLYNTVRYQLQQTIRAYLRHTRRPYPVYLVFDMSDMRPSF